VPETPDKPATFPTQEDYMRTLTSPIIIATLAILVSSASAEPSKAPPAEVKPVLTRPLPDLPGKEVSIATVEYPPGGATGPHRHDSDTFVYVLEGAVVMQVEGGKEVTLHAGDTFYESPTDIHRVSRNASSTARAKFLVFSVKNEGAPGTRRVD
jgi:quercetin dioxygenase-like cupin family protein